MTTVISIVLTFDVALIFHHFIYQTNVINEYNEKPQKLKSNKKREVRAYLEKRLNKKKNIIDCGQTDVS